MVTFELPSRFTDIFIEKLPAQRDVIQDLLADQKIQSYSLSVARDKLWCLVNAKNELEVVKMLGTFPLIAFMTYEISELMFHNVATIQVPAFSLN